MPPKKSASHRTNTAASKLAERVVGSLASDLPQPTLAGATPSPRIIMVSMDQFNLLVTQVQRLVTTIPAIQATLHHLW